MSSLTLDGSTRFVGTDFIKLLNTGTSNLATENYVLEQVAIGTSSTTTDLSDYYTIAQTNTLLDTKLNITNPQDITGMLRLGHISGNSQIMLNAVSSAKDFYVNGNAEINGNHLVNSLDSSGYIKGTSLITNTINTNNINDVVFLSNSVPYAQFDVSADRFEFLKPVRTSSNITSTAEINSAILKSNFISNKDALTNLRLQINSNDFMTFNIANNNIEVDRDIEMHSSRLKSNIIDTWTNADLEIKRNNVNFMELKTDNRIIANQVLQCGGNLKTQEIDTVAPLDMVLKVSGNNFLELKTDDRIIANKLVQCGSNLKTQEIDTVAPLDLIMKRNNVSMVELQDGLTLLNTKTECINNIVCDTFESRNLTTSTILNHVMNESTGEIKFYVGSPTVPDATTNLVMTLQNNLITFHKPTSLGTIDDTNYVKKTGETLQIVDGAVVVGGGVQNGTDTLTVNGTAYVSGNATVNGNFYITPNGYMFNAGAAGAGARSFNYVVLGTTGSIHQFFIGNANNLRVQFAWNDCYFTPNVVCFASVKSNAIDTHNDSDLIFNRNGVEFMKFERTLGQVEMTVGVKSNTYDSIGNADVAFRRNFVDFLYLRNGYVEVNSGASLWSANALMNNIDTAGVSDMTFKRNGVDYLYLRNGYVEVNASSSLWPPNARINDINTTGDTDLVFKRNGVEFLRFDGPNTVTNGPENLLLVNDSNVGISSSWVFANVFANRTGDTDTDFRGAIPAGLDSGIVYMTYEHATENLHIKTDVEIDQDKKLYIHKQTGASCHISSTNIASVNHTTFENEDINGELRFRTNGGTKMYIRANDLLVGAGYVFSGDFNDTSDKTKKYDIKDAEYNFTEIIKQIKPKTFKMKDEKEIGITKNHIGFVADDLVPVLPEDIENIVNVNQDGIKTLSYMKLTSILWGAMKEQQTKIEHLEAKMFEMMEEINLLKKPKTRTRTTAKTTT